MSEQEKLIIQWMIGNGLVPSDWAKSNPACGSPQMKIYSKLAHELAEKLKPDKEVDIINIKAELLYGAIAPYNDGETNIEQFMEKILAITGKER